MRELKLVIIFAAAAAAIGACTATGSKQPDNAGNTNTAPNSGAATNSNASAATPEVASADGRQLYADSCMICHKDTGKGGPVTVQGKKLKPIDLTSERRKKQSDDDLIKDIQEGDPDEGMPAFKEKLKPEEIKQIVTYIRKLQDAG